MCRANRGRRLIGFDGHHCNALLSQHLVQEKSVRTPIDREHSVPAVHRRIQATLATSLLQDGSPSLSVAGHLQRECEPVDWQRLLMQFHLFTIKSMRFTSSCTGVVGDGLSGATGRSQISVGVLIELHRSSIQR